MTTKRKNLSEVKMTDDVTILDNYTITEEADILISMVCNKYNREQLTYEANRC